MSKSENKYFKKWSIDLKMAQIPPNEGFIFYEKRKMLREGRFCRLPELQK